MTAPGSSHTAERRPLSGWGRYRVVECRVAEPRTLDDLRAVVTDRSYPTVIARGLGRSYGDSAIDESGMVVVQTSLDRIIECDND